MSEIAAEKRVRRGLRLSPINEIVHQNVLQIRQNLIDQHWLGRLAIYDEEHGIVRKAPSKRTKSDWDTFYFHLADLVNSEISGSTYKHPDPLPETPESVSATAQAIGIGTGRLKELEAGNQFYTVEEMLAFAYLGNVDVAFMLTPTVDVLALESDFSLSHPFPKDSSLVDWMLWISNLKQFNALDSKDYLSNTSIPSIHRERVNGKKIRDPEAFEELLIRARNEFSTLSALTTRDPDSGLVSEERRTFLANSDPWIPRTKMNNLEVIQRILFLRTRMRVLVNITRSKSKPIPLKGMFDRRFEYLSRDLRNLINLFRDSRF